MRRSLRRLAAALAIAAFVSPAATTAPAAPLPPPDVEWTFAVAQQSGTGAAPVSLAVADLDRDGRLDVAAGGTSGVTVHFGRGDGSFDAPAVVAAGGAVSAVWAGDLTGDGRPDLVLGRASTDGVEIHPGAASRTFGAPTVLAGPAGIVDLVPWQWLSAYRPTLAFASPAAPGFGIVYRGDDGFATAVYDDAAIASPRALATADLFGDGWPELLVCTPSALGGYLMGHDAVGGITTIASPTGTGIATGAVERNGTTDVVIVGPDGFRVFGDELSHRFTLAAESIGGTPTRVRLADFDGDGATDAIVVHEHGAVALRGRGDGTFDVTTFREARDDLRDAVVGDFDRDGRPDVAFAAESAGGVVVRLNRVAWSAGGLWSPALQLGVGNFGFEPAAADLDRDGRLDVCAVDWGTSTLRSFRNVGDGTFEAWGSWSCGNGTRALAVADLNEDARPDVVTASCWGNGVDVQLGNLIGQFGAPASFESGPWPYDAQVADMDRDGHLDLVIGHSDYSGPGTVSVLRGRGDGTFAAPDVLHGGTNGADVALADFDGDGDLDIAFVSVNLSHASRVSVFLQRADHGWDGPADYATGDASQGLDSADVDRDGDADLVVANYGTGDLSWFAGRGDGTFEDQVRIPLPDGAGPIDALLRDVDRDGRLDVIVPDIANPRVFLLPGHGDGTFGTPVEIPSGERASYTVAGDFFGDDGLDDLAVMGRDGTLELLRNSDAPGDVAADPADWGRFLIGDAGAAAHDVVVRNTGAGVLRVSGVAVTDGDFAVAAGQATAFDVAAGTDAAVALVCTSAASGPCAGALRITSDDPDEPTFDVSLAAEPEAWLASQRFATLGSTIDLRGPIGARGGLQLRSGKRRSSLRIVAWTAGTPGTVRAVVSAKKLAEGTWDLAVLAKKSAPVVLPAEIVVPPPALSAAGPIHGAAGDVVAVAVQWPGTRRGTVALVDPSNGRRRTCVVKEWPTAPDAGTVRFAVPKRLPAGSSWDVRVTTGVGVATLAGAFTAD